MAKKLNSLVHLLLLPLHSLIASANEHQVHTSKCAGLDKSTCESVHSWAKSEEEESHGLELFQLKGLQKVNGLPRTQRAVANRRSPHVLDRFMFRSSHGVGTSKRHPPHVRSRRFSDVEPPFESFRGNDFFETTTYPSFDEPEQALNVHMPDETMMSEPLAQEPLTQLKYDQIPTNCMSELSGVDDTTLSDALAGKTRPTYQTKKSPAASSQLRTLRQQRIFIAALLHNSEEILAHWTKELVRLLMALRGADSSANLFVSVYESGSEDGTPQLLREVAERLDFIGVEHRIVTGGETRGLRQRIEFLADMRNKALAPLMESSQTYDSVLWLSDNLFCADGVLQMLVHGLPQAWGGLGADAVCGMDYAYGDMGNPENPKSCLFYDVWASHDIAGNNFQNSPPIIHSGDGVDALPGPGNRELEDGQPFQVFSCWSAMAVFRADIFQRDQLRFRSSQAGECSVAETELIFRDMWSIGRGKIVVSPTAVAAYEEKSFERCGITRQPTRFDGALEIAWKPQPKSLKCCPLQPGQDFVDFGTCYTQRWNGTDRLAVDPPPYAVDPSPFSFLQLDATTYSYSNVASFLNKDLHVLSSSQLERVHTSFLHVRSEHREMFNIVGASALAVFVLFSFVYLKGLKGGMKENSAYTIILFWMVMSLLMNLLNKECTFLLSCPLTLVIIQMVVTVILLGPSTSLSGIRMEDLWRWCALSILFGLMLCSSMFAFSHASVTCLLILRNCQPLLTLLAEKSFLAKAPQISGYMVMSLTLVGIGATLYANFAPGYSVTTTGLGFILINCLATVAHRVLERHLLTSDMRLSFETMTLINNVVPLIPVGLLAWMTGETQQWPKYTHLFHSPMSIAIIVCSGIVGLCLGQSSIMVQACVSATSMTVLQTFNKIFIILAAMIAFSERFTPLSCIGCLLSIFGCAAYGMVQGWNISAPTASAKS